MALEKLLNILAGITTVALVSVLVASGETAKIIKAFGSSYADALKAAKA